MRSQPALPSEKYVWGTLAPRFERELMIQTLVIWQLCGLFDVYGPLDENFTGFAEGSELIKQLTGSLLRALALDMSSRQYGSAKRSVGRPPDQMIPHLATALLDCYLRFHNSAGRQSVLTSIDGKLTQMEAGPFFQYLKTVLAPLNRYLVEELHRRPLSPARVARFALADRRFLSAKAARHADAPSICVDELDAGGFKSWRLRTTL